MNESEIANEVSVDETSTSISTEVLKEPGDSTVKLASNDSTSSSSLSVPSTPLHRKSISLPIQSNSTEKFFVSVTQIDCKVHKLRTIQH
jgi:hypothetical protein